MRNTLVGQYIFKKNCMFLLGKYVSIIDSLLIFNLISGKVCAILYFKGNIDRIYFIVWSW